MITTRHSCCVYHFFLFFFSYQIRFSEKRKNQNHFISNSLSNKSRKPSYIKISEKSIHCKLSMRHEKWNPNKSRLSGNEWWSWPDSKKSYPEAGSWQIAVLPAQTCGLCRETGSVSLETITLVDRGIQQDGERYTEGGRTTLNHLKQLKSQHSFIGASVHQ